MSWIKKGLIYAPEKKYSWDQKYGMMPTPVYDEGADHIRVYFGVTDNQNNGRTTYIDVSADNPAEIITVADNCVLDIGEPGYFDDSGAVPSSVIKVDGSLYLYYVGFQRCEKVPYMLFSGLAISKTGNEFIRYSQAPIIDRSKINPISNAAPYVIKDGDAYKMWFWLGKEWVRVNNKLYIKAQICFASSPDGLNWEVEEKPCIELDEKKEFSVGRPCVIKEDGMYRMWYSVRHIGKLYRLGYAESSDGITWNRMDDKAGIDVSESGWDSEMICYPAVVKAKGKTYLFYNGNNNGETGFGYAELVS